MDQRALSTIVSYQGISGLVLTAGAGLWTRSWLLTTAVFVGVLIMAANLWLMTRLVHRLVEQVRSSGQSGAMPLLYLGFKFLMVVGAISVAVLVFNLNANFLFLGMCSLFFGLVFGLMHTVLTQRTVHES